MLAGPKKITGLWRGRGLFKNEEGGISGSFELRLSAYRPQKREKLTLI